MSRNPHAGALRHYKPRTMPAIDRQAANASRQMDEELDDLCFDPTAPNTGG